MPRTPQKSTDETRTARDGVPSPRLPHERDESGDAPSGATAEPIRQAEQDVERGLRQTDRGEATDATYRRQKRDEPD